MALFSKKKEVVRELPKFEEPLFPEMPRERVEHGLSELPSLPSLPSMPLIKSEQIRTQPRSFTMDMSESREISRLKEPIFVKIDKFRDALSNLEFIKKKLQESSELLDKIKAIRSNEEEELEQWSHEINLIKDKIDMIDKKLFSEIEQ
jgi:hypothetical protein